jgi:hypothetical protein
VPLGALLLYWSVRSGYDSFYQRFHLTPEQVGIGQVEMIARTAYTLGLLLFVFAGFWIALLVALSAAEGPAWRSHATAAVALGVPALLLLLVLSSRAYSWVGFVPFMVALACVGKSVALYHEERRGQPGWFKRLRTRHGGLLHPASDRPDRPSAACRRHHP